MSHEISRLTDHAPIVHRTDSDICFRVDNVMPCPTPLPLTQARPHMEKKLDRPLKGCSHEQASTIVREEHGMTHSLVQAVHLAFSQHRPLVLTPDAIWITLAQGFAQHLNNHAEALRSRVVAHKGKVSITATASDVATPQAWSDVIEQWSAGVQPQIPAELYQLILCEFSTTTPITRTVSQVVMLDAFQQYFDYALWFICGIPTITLQGSVEDWVAIRQRVEVMAGYHLEWWTDRLKPICDGFIETVQGQPSKKFWQHIYSPKEAYGGHLITGWVADLFPYLKDTVTQAPTVRNPILAIPRAQLTSDVGLSPGRLPTGLSRAPFTMTDAFSLAKKELELVAGFIGVKQHAETGNLEPEIGWAVLEEDEWTRVMTFLASRALTGQQATTSDTKHETSQRYAHIEDIGVPKECIQLMERYPDGQVFFNQTTHPWSLKPLAELILRDVTSDKLWITSPAVHMMDLVDGRAIAYVSIAPNRFERSNLWIIVGNPDGQAFHQDSVRVIAKGFVQFLQRLTDANGSYYFDEPHFQPDVVL